MDGISLQKGCWEKHWEVGLRGECGPGSLPGRGGIQTGS